jgi:hypothetical protein
VGKGGNIVQIATVQRASPIIAGQLAANGQAMIAVYFRIP